MLFAGKMDCRVEPANDDDLMRTLFHAAGEELLAGRWCRQEREQRMGLLAFLRARQHGRPIGQHDLHLVGYGAGTYDALAVPRLDFGDGAEAERGRVGAVGEMAVEQGGGVEASAVVGQAETKSVPAIVPYGQKKERSVYRSPLATIEA